MKNKLKFYVALFCVSLFIGYKFLQTGIKNTDVAIVDSSANQQSSSIAENVSKIIENHDNSNDIAEVSSGNLDVHAIPHEVEVTVEMINQILAVRSDDFLLGNPDAKVKIIQYSSLTCPACKYYQTSIFEKLRADYIDTGKVVYIAREFPFDKPAYQAAILARCGGREKYYTFLSVLFKNQDSWAYRKNYQELLANIGQLGGVGAEEFAGCINDPMVNQVVEQNNNDARNKLKLLYAPTLFINDVRIEGEISHNYELLSQKIKEQLDK
jgi:protein-disulfide isomerase